MKKLILTLLVAAPLTVSAQWTAWVYHDKTLVSEYTQSTMDGCVATAWIETSDNPDHTSFTCAKNCYRAQGPWARCDVLVKFNGHGQYQGSEGLD